MRITQVEGINYQRTNYQNKVNEKKAGITNSYQSNVINLPRYSYGRDLVNRTSPTFKGSEISKTALALIEQLPIEDKLASIFQIIRHGDIIVLGKDFSKAQKALNRNIKKVNHVIKKEFYLPSQKTESNFAFIKNSSGEIEALNINDKKMSLTTGGKKYFLDPGDSFFVIENDTLEYANDVLHIKKKPKADLSMLRQAFSKVYDYTAEVQEDIAKLNQKTVSKRILFANTPNSKVTFAKIGGQAKAIEELKKSILYPIKYPAGYSTEDITRGFILHGPAGTGKTELCRALANEANISSEYISGTAFQSKWVGESEANVRAFFDRLKENQPAIGIIDEIDAIGAERGDDDKYGAKLVDQILTCMTDIYNSGDNVFILGLTNKYEGLDKALKRAERFSKHILVGPPDKDGVKEILKIHTEGKRLDKNINLDLITEKMYQAKAVGGDIKYMTKLARENMMNRLGIYEKMENGTFTSKDMENATITNEDFLNAVDDFVNQHRGTKQRKAIGFVS